LSRRARAVVLCVVAVTWMSVAATHAVDAQGTRAAHQAAQGAGTGGVAVHHGGVYGQHGRGQDQQLRRRDHDLAELQRFHAQRDRGGQNTERVVDHDQVAVAVADRRDRERAQARILEQVRVVGALDAGRKDDARTCGRRVFTGRCGGWRVFLARLWRALVPTGLLAFTPAWTEFLFALTFTSSNATRTVPVAIALLSGGSQYEIPWGNIMAASVIVTVPLVVLVLIFQRKIISGLTAGGVKG